MKKLLICDSNALFHRSRSALSRAMGEVETPFGVPVTGTFGFLNALFSVIEKYEFDSVVTVYDAGKNWRKKENDEYKAGRKATSMEHRADQSLLIEEVLPALGFTPCGVSGYEADDIIATISRNSPAYQEIVILTCDKDLLQLVNNKTKVLLFNSAKQMKLLDIDGVLEMYGVFPAEVKYYKALVGDSSDNITGIKGIGPKTAEKIIKDCRPKGLADINVGSISIAMHSRVCDSAAQFGLNLRLITLDGDVPDLRWFASSPPAVDTIRNLFDGLGFKSYLKPARFNKILKALKVEVR